MEPGNQVEKSRKVMEGWRRETSAVSDAVANIAVGGSGKDDYDDNDDGLGIDNTFKILQHLHRVERSLIVFMFAGDREKRESTKSLTE